MSEINLSEVTEAETGCWIEGSGVRNPVEFSVEIISLAIRCGLEVKEAWYEDKAKFLEGEYTFEMLEELSFVTDVALDFLNENVREGFYFDFEDGLYLFNEKPEDDLTNTIDSH